MLSATSAKLLGLMGKESGAIEYLTMIVPDGDPGELLMAQKKIKVCSVTGVPCAVVLKREDGSVRQGNSTNAPAVAIVVALVLVNVVTNMDDIVDRVFSNGVAVSVKVAEREVAA